MAVMQGLFMLAKGMPPDDFYRWTDEFGNQVLPVFTTDEASREFSESRLDEWMLNGFHATDAVGIIVEYLHKGTQFFALDPISETNFTPLEAQEILSILVRHAYQDGLDGLSAWPEPRDEITTKHDPVDPDTRIWANRLVNEMAGALNRIDFYEIADEVLGPNPKIGAGYEGPVISQDSPTNLTISARVWMRIPKGHV